jgi:hypothetical protein
MRSLIAALGAVLAFVVGSSVIYLAGLLAILGLINLTAGSDKHASDTVVAVVGGMVKGFAWWLPLSALAGFVMAVKLYHGWAAPEADIN